MIQRMSHLFLRTLRDDPADAELPGHRLLVRAGYIRRAAPGIYTWLPLGLRVRRKVEDIIREEMAAIGAQELRFPALLPREPYEETGRWTEYGPNLFRLKDRKEADYLLGPTHEEMFTLAVKDMYSSYKELPVSLYQIQDKYRDEARPRGGLLRGREFTMKDSYSFDVSQEGLEESYAKHREAYVRIFDRLGFEYVIVKATSGAMGGSASEEFLGVSEHGEDTFVRNDDGTYAANVEAVKVPAPEAIPHDGLPAASKLEPGDTPTIATLVEHLNATDSSREWTGADTLKNVLIMVETPAGERYPLAIGVPGDREVDAKRLEAALEPNAAVPFEEKDFKEFPALVKGYIGPAVPGGEKVLGEESATGIKYLLDPRVVSGTSWVTGANEDRVHVRDLVCGRDFEGDGVIDVAEVRDGDPAPGGGTLHTARGIELGHIFQLGTKYAEALDLKVLDENGKLVTVTMGSYGVGVTRAVAAVAEATCDDIGLNWPKELAPFDLHIVVAGKDAAAHEYAASLAEELSAQGVDVLLDDRPKVSPGVKFKDAELLGVPTILTVGRGFKDGVLEIKDRTSGDKREVATADVVAELTN